MAAIESLPTILLIILGSLILILAFVKPKSIKHLKWIESGNIYTIKFAKQKDGTYHVRVLSRPVNRNTSCRSKTHLLERNRICTSKPIESRERAEIIAEYWIKGYETCLKTGHFPDEGNQST